MPRTHEILDAVVGICDPSARMGGWEIVPSLEDRGPASLEHARDPISNKVESEHSHLRATLWLAYI